MSNLESIFKLGVIVAAMDKLSGPVKKIVSSLSGLQRAAKKAQATVDVGQRLAVSAALVEGAAEKMRRSASGLITPFTEAQDAMAPLQTVTTSTTGSMVQSMDMEKKAATDWSKKHRQAAAAFLAASYLMASAGLNDVQAVAGTRVAMTVATATMGDQSEAATLLATVYNNVGDKTKNVTGEMTRLGDVLVKSQQQFQYANLGVLNESLKYGIPAALGSRVAFEDLNVALGLLNNSGLEGSAAGTAFAGMLRQLVPASQKLGFAIARNKDGSLDLIGTLENLRKKYGDLGNVSDATRVQFQQAFGDEGLRAVQLLSGKLDKARGALDSLKNSAGAAAAAQQTMEATTGAQTQILLNNVQDLKMSLGDQLAPTLMSVIPMARSLVDSLAGFATAHPALARTVSLVVLVGAGLLSIVAPILSVVSGFVILTGHAMQSAVWIGKAIKYVAVWSKGGGLVKALGQLKDFTLGLVNMARQAIVTAWNAIPALVSSVWSFTAALLANPITWIIIGLVALGAAIYLLWKHWDTVSAVLARGWDGIKAGWAVAMNWMRGILDGLIGFFRKWGVEILAVFFPFIGLPLLIFKHWGSIREIAGQALAGLINWLRGLGATFAQSGAALWEAFVGGIRSIIDKPRQVVQEGLARLRRLLPFSDAKEGPLSALTQSGAAMIQTFSAGAKAAMPDLRKTVATGLAGAALTMPLAGPAMPSSPPVRLPASVVAGARPIVIQRLELHVDRVDSPEDLWKALRQLAGEVGSAEGDGLV